MFWNAQKKRSDQDFQEWKLQEKKTLVDAHLKEVSEMHTRIKARLSNVLSLSVTLCSVTAAGAYSGSKYTLPCSIMLCGFAVVALMAIVGLWSTNVTTHNLGPDIFDKIIEDIPPVATNKSEGLTEITATFYDIASDNLRKAQKDRLILKCAWVFLPLAPFVAWIVSLCF